MPVATLELPQSPQYPKGGPLEALKKAIVDALLKVFVEVTP